MKWIKENVLQLVAALLIAAAFWVTMTIRSELRDYVTIARYELETRERAGEAAARATKIESVAMVDRESIAGIRTDIAALKSEAVARGKQIDQIFDVVVLKRISSTQ